VIGGLAARIEFGSDANAGWRWAFIAVVVLGLVSAVLSLALARDSAAPQGRSLDWPGQLTIAVALFGLLFAVIQGPTSGWGSAQVVAGFVLAAVFLVLFILAERRSSAPLLRLEFFVNRAFVVVSVITVVGGFAFLGTAYATSIRLAAIQGFTPLKTSIAFVFLNGMTLVQAPLTARLLERYNSKWVLGGGFFLIGAADMWLAAAPTTDLSLAPIVVPLIAAGVGSALALSALTAAAVNTMPNHLAGMASATTTMLRDLGFTLGPAIVGAVALSRAAGTIQQHLAASPALQHALAAFNASAAHVPAAQRPSVEAAIQTVGSGPLEANAVPGTVTLPTGLTEPFNPLKDVAFDALSNAYSVGYIFCGAAALLAAALSVAAVGEGARETLLDPQTLAE
jgi:MFS family permease